MSLSTGLAACLVLLISLQGALGCPTYYNTSVMRTNCSNAALKQVPSDISFFTTHLYLSYNNLTSIGDEDFSDMPRLKHLELQHNQIQSIDPTAFEDLISLTTLNISCNNLTTFHRMLLYRNKELTTLDLSYNNFKVPHTEFFTFIGYGSNVFLRGCNLSEFSFPSLSHRATYSTVDISFNNLVTLNLSIPYALRLDTLRVTNNSRTLQVTALNISDYMRILDFTGTPLDLTQILPVPSQTMLSTLVLNDCKLTEYPLHMTHHLTPFELQLNHNMLSRLDSSIAYPNIRRLYLRHNQISKIQLDTISSMKYLTVLALSYNSFDLPKDESFLSNENLEILEMRSCAISHLSDKTFQNLKSLEDIDLSGNSVSIIQQDVFKNLRHLYKLHLRGNKISVIEGQSFLHNTKLSILDVSENPLLLPGDMFISAPSVVWLNMSACNLTGLPKDTFSHNRLIQTLDVSFNYIQYIDANSFSYLSKLNVLNMSHNPLVCDFKLRPLWLLCFENDIACTANCSIPEGPWNLLESVTSPVGDETSPSTTTTTTTTTTTSTATGAAIIATTRSPERSVHASVAPTVIVLLLVGLVVGAVLGSVSGCIWLQKYLFYGNTRTSSVLENSLEESSLVD